MPNKTIGVKVSTELLDKIRTADPIHYKNIPAVYLVDTALREFHENLKAKEKK